MDRISNLPTHLLELPLCGADADLPSVAEAIVDPGDAVLLGAQVHVHVLLEGLDGQAQAVEEDLRRVVWGGSPWGPGTCPHTPGRS